ncbi:ABC transporter ATP-binding protein [Pedobacter mendelii]|uniref:ABC transporter ATP-binding protein n=1 Tax=Pedobacter mendelii TaxID=1908240 RepID=A0ABQ2BE35_9SPHI|nr:ATP-binding cassette domain-containing protein [Pedobacter mendelii]GGI23315.1 ABC transporter ATP-binding protein [Pedobacter mendelii]
MLQAIGLTKKYKDHTALNKLNLTIEAGEIYCLLGQNGAGKTTVINLFLGFTEATSGEARINGLVVKPNDPSVKKFLAYIPEVVMLYGNLNSMENLDFFSKIAGFTYTSQELEDFLLQVGLQPEAFYRPLGNYSKGMRQKVGIAIALAKNADVLLMDEPTSGLDPKATNEFTELVKSLGKQGKIVLMATHDIFNAVNVGTTIGIMRQGTLVHELSAADINANDLQKLYLETI